MNDIKEQAISKREIRKQMTPESVMASGFLLLILAGTVLLAQPAAAQTGVSIGWRRSLFTSVSAVCVTGLTVVETGSTFSLSGQIILLVLIQTGGLGFMIFATLILRAAGKRITLRDRVLLRESMSESTMSGITRILWHYGAMAAVVEGMGVVLMCTHFVPLMGWGRGIYISLWHAVSAFCNAGFDVFGQGMSLAGDKSNVVVLLTAAGLMITGGLGFSVLDELIHRKAGKRLSLHARISVSMTVGMLLGGTLFLLITEYHGVLVDMPAGSKFLHAFFQSATMRTAGFRSVALSELRDPSKLGCMLLMIIGASPASTGGGVKTTTVAVLLLILMSVIRGDEDVNVAGRRLPTDLMRRAVAVLLIHLGVLLVGVMALMVIEGGRWEFMDLLFETVSALATVGVSSIGTENLTPAGQFVLMPLMFFGRVGPLTLASAMAQRQKRRRSRIRYPEESIPIG